MGILIFVRVGRIELPSRPWQGRILPLNHTRILYTFIKLDCAPTRIRT